MYLKVLIPHGSIFFIQLRVMLTTRWLTFNNEINHPVLICTLTFRSTTDSKCPSWSEKRILVASRKGYCSLDAKAWASRRRLATGQHYLSEPVYKTVTVWSSRCLMFWVALVSFKNKVRACWRNPKGWVSALLPPPLFSARPQTNCETAGVQVRPRVGHYSPTMTLLSSTFWVS